MLSSAAVALMMVLGAVCLVAFLACVYVVRAERARAEQRVATDVGTRIGRHGLWVGAWLVGIPAERARSVREEARSEAGKQAPPDRILELWQSAGAELISHLPGPEVATEAEACGWLEHASDELAQAPLSPLAAGDRRSVFALVYACTEPPPARAVGFRELRDRLLGPACVGAAFVACPEGAPGGADDRLPLGVIGLAKWAFLAASLAGLLGGGVALALSDRTAAATPVDAGAPASNTGTAAALNIGAASSGPAAKLNESAAASSAAIAPGEAASGSAFNATAPAASGEADPSDGGTAAGAVPSTKLSADPSPTATAPATGVTPASAKSVTSSAKPKAPAVPTGGGTPGASSSQTSTGTRAP